MSDSYSDHTLVITTFNRPRYLFRLLSYIVRDLPIGRIRVVDGSLEPHRSENCRIVEAFADRMSITLDQVEPGIDILDHHRYAHSCTETPFMTFCHDDNFCVPATIRASIEFLRGHPEYVNCCGLIAGINRSTGRTTAYVLDIDRLEQDEPLERLAHFLANHWSADFGTWRSEVRRSAVSIFDLYRLDESIGEPLTCGISALAGKFHLISAVSVIFCEHESNRGTGASKRKSNVVRPEFMQILGTAGDVLSSYCRSYGVEPPADARAWYLTAYLRFMGKGRHQFHKLVRGMRKQAEASLPRSVLAAIDVRAEQAVLDRLLHFDTRQVAAVRTLQANVEKEFRPSTVELFVVLNDDVLLVDMSWPKGDATEIMQRPRASAAPEPYGALSRMLLEPDWHQRYAAFRDQTVRHVLGSHADRADAPELFDSACLTAFINILRPLDGTHPSRVPYLAGLLDIDGGLSPARDELLAAVSLFEAYAFPTSGANDPEPTATQPGVPARYRILRNRPLADSIPLPFVPGEVKHAQGVAFIPLDLSGAPARFYGLGYQLWLSVEVAEVEGRVQFSLCSGGALDLLVTVSEQSGPRELHFAIRSLQTDYLTMRDLCHPGAAGRCVIASMRWMVSPTPASDGTTSKAAALAVAHPPAKIAATNVA